MQRSDFRHLDRQRVRWAEVDMQKIVFNGHYLMYFDTAVAGYWRAMAMPYEATMAQLQGDLYVRKATVEYEGSARYDDLLETGIRCARIGRSSMVFEVAVFRGERRLVHGELVYVFADPATQTSRPVPPELRALLEGFEAGQPMVELRLGGWDGLGAEARAIRDGVFAQEQGIDAELAEDEADVGALHALAVNRFGVAVACGRLLPSDGGVARIGRMAVLRMLRGVGLGRRVLEALMQAARTRGDQLVELDAEVTAQAFYQRAGFAVAADPTVVAGVPHVRMRCRL